MPKNEMNIGRALSRSRSAVVFLNEARVTMSEGRYTSIRPMIYDAGKIGAVTILIAVDCTLYFYDARSGVCIGWSDRKLVRIVNGLVYIDRETE